ncbi:hypothetical protein OS493_010711 [Desmophyllum pertusum]|uniref:Uncharacterized protein n=1 Tax=Desmophyllum pertusum TaxID=174260 RepID=A0A9W9ZRS0_9CNID|nr:hypothetical protein OS493_010711 [Desmophyllum pertusum]
MNVRLKGRLLSRRNFMNRKSLCDDTRWLLISDSNSEISEQTQIFDFNQASNGWSSMAQDFNRTRRTSSVTENGFANTRNTNDAKCKTGSCERCSYPRIVALVSDDVKPCLPSPSLMRRRNAICDEIEKRTMAMAGRTLRQKRVDMLRSIALTQFSLL